MRSAIVRLTVATLTISMLVGGAHAQGMGGGRKGGRHQQTTDKADAQKPKADDKAYSAALKTLPDKPFDPWSNAR
jgi:hypothetical protein